MFIPLPSTIGNLTATTAATDADLGVVVQGGVTKNLNRLAWLAGYANEFNVCSPAYGGGADPTGTKDSTAAFATAVAALNAAGGGTLKIPYGVYKLTGPFVFTTSVVTVQGHGWNTTAQAAFGDAQWTTAGTVTGTVLMFQGTGDGFQFSGTHCQGVTLRDLALIGPGSGTSVGLNFTGSSVAYNRFHNVFVANWSVDLLYSNGLDINLWETHLRGATIGLQISGAVADTHFWYCEIQACTTAGLIQGGTGIHFHGGLIQDNTNGINVSGATTSVVDINFDSVHFELNTNYAIQFDCTTQPISVASVLRCHFGSTSPTISFLGTRTLDGLTFDIIDGASVALTIPSNVNNPVIRGGSRWTSLNTSACSTAIVMGAFATTNNTHSGLNVGGIFQVDTSAQTITATKTIAGAGATFSSNVTVSGTLTASSGLSSPAGNGYALAAKWLVYCPATSCVIRDTVNSRNQMSFFAGAAGAASAQVLDQLTVKRGVSGQTADLLQCLDENSAVLFAVGKDGNLHTANAVAATTPGSVIDKLPIYNAAGTLIGYIPIYNTIT